MGLYKPGVYHIRVNLIVKPRRTSLISVSITENSDLIIPFKDIDNMVKARVKKERKEETTAEFVARMNLGQAQKKRYGLKKNLKGARR